MSPETSLIGVVIVTLFFLVLVWRILAQIRVLGPGLILLGLVTAMAAICYGTFGAALGVHGAGGPGQMDATVAVGAALQAGVLMRISVILVLAGVAACLMADWSPLPSQRPEPISHVEQR